MLNELNGRFLNHGTININKDDVARGRISNDGIINNHGTINMSGGFLLILLKMVLLIILMGCLKYSLEVYLIVH